MSDSTLYLYTSLTAGSSHIVTATARLETILKANKLPFKALDVATDEAARKLWGRRAKGKKLPGLVKFGTIVGDLEQIEEWNEFGELRMEVNNVQDLDGVSATATPTTSAPATVDTQAANKPTETEPATPKPSTITIQSPPATKPAEKKDEQVVLALRQAGSEAAAKAKYKSEKKETDVSNVEETASKPARAHRGSVAPELPDTVPDSPKVPKRPPLVPEVAAESSANFHADNAEALGLVQHHRGSIIATGDKGEQDKAVHEIRQSISTDGPGKLLDGIRKEAAQKAQEGTIEETIEEPKPSAEETKDDNTKDEDEGESKEEPTATDPAPKEEPKAAEAPPVPE